MRRPLTTGAVLATTPVLLAAALAGAIAGGCASARHARSRLPDFDAGPAPPIRGEHAIEIDGERIRLTREYLRIHNPPLAARLPEEPTLESISFEPRVVVVHFTAIPTLSGTLEAFAAPHVGSERPLIRDNGLLNVGVQFLVDRDGTIYQLYPETVIARHVIGLNHVAIGIENVGDGDLGRRRAGAPLTREQLDANVALVRYLAARHPSLDYLIGHSEYRRLERRRHPARGLFYEELPGYRTRKFDPGRRFLGRLRRALREAAGATIG